MNNTNMLIRILVVILFVGVVAGVFYVYYNQSNVSYENWTPYQNSKFGFKVMIPPEHTAYLDTGTLYITPEATEENETPMPAITIRIHKTSIENVLKNYENKNVQVISVKDVNLHNASGKRVVTKIEMPPEAQLPQQYERYLFEGQDYTMALALWEGLEDPYFEDLANSFTLLK